jgi:hypothetical protein
MTSAIHVEPVFRNFEKLVVMDAFLPGVPGWELAYDSGIWP